MNVSKSFQPIIGKSPRILILGTLPGKESLRLNQYYANSRNLFWKIIYNIFDTSLEVKYNKRIQFLKMKKIALWDVCHVANRKSSLDSDIKEEIPNQINQLLEDNPTIENVAFNGQKAEKLYSKYFINKRGINYRTLLSTSPANASYSYEKKIDNWSSIINDFSS